MSMTWSGRSGRMPVALISTSDLTRPSMSRSAISEAIQPPIEFPITITASSLSSASRSR